MSINLAIYTIIASSPNPVLISDLKVALPPDATASSTIALVSPVVSVVVVSS